MSCQDTVHDFTGKGGGLQKQCNCGKSWWDAKDQIIATLTAERDDYKAHFEVCDTNRQQVVIERDAYRAERDALLDAQWALVALADRLKCEVQTLRIERDTIRDEKLALMWLVDKRNREVQRLTTERDAAVEKVREMAAQYDVLAKQLAETESDLQAVVEDLQMAQGQWGDEYLWEKWGLNEALARPGVKRMMEAKCSPQTK
jgi:chromosome segregation ATPase